MNAVELLKDALSRIGDQASRAVDGLSADDLNARIEGRSNSIAWLVWHAARGHDAQVAQAFDVEELWTASGWVERFALPLPAADTGYGHSSEDVAKVRVQDGGLLLGYLHDTVARTTELVGELDEAALDRVVDDRWDPPVTLAVRLVSVVDDDVQHLGQAAFLRGVLERR
jgi:hypothetical protein